MAANFHENFANGTLAPPSERSTGLTFAAVALIAAYLWRAHVEIAATLLGCSTALLMVSLAAPSSLKRLNIAWFRFGQVLNKIVTPVIMLAMFAMVIVPFGLIMQHRSDPLRKRRQPDAQSYWIDCEEDARSSSMANQF